NQETKVVEKCTLCAQLQAIGEKPACVKNCPGKARFVGDIDDPNSEISQVIKKAGSDSVHCLPDVKNQPSARYILHSKIATWKE
ncbi:MAG: 4Fe-4S dicluster domain-containing protein, partial [Sporomusa sp.]